MTLRRGASLKALRIWIEVIIPIALFSRLRCEIPHCWRPHEWSLAIRWCVIHWKDWRRWCVLRPLAETQPLSYIIIRQFQNTPNSYFIFYHLINLNAAPVLFSHTLKSISHFCAVENLFIVIFRPRVSCLRKRNLEKLPQMWDSIPRPTGSILSRCFQGLTLAIFLLKRRFVREYAPRTRRWLHWWVASLLMLLASDNGWCRICSCASGWLGNLWWVDKIWRS